jgi:hypothetical protein
MIGAGIVCYPLRLRSTSYYSLIPEYFQILIGVIESFGAHNGRNIEKTELPRWCVQE